MIKELFLPEKFGNQRIIAQKIVGITIQDDAIYATLVHAKRSASIIEKLHEEKIEKGKDEERSEYIVQALKKIVAALKPYDQVRISIPASIIVFKEIEVPFSDIEKIRMVLDYEIEPMLPFSLDEAIIDFVITKELKGHNASQVLVAAVRTQDLQNILDLYTKADIEPSSITIDLFALHGLYEQIPEYQSIQPGSALVELGLNTTRISFLQNGQLRLTRYVPRGLSTITEAISKDAAVPIDQVLQKFITDGMKATGDDAYNRSVQKHVISLFNDIQFTLNSFSLKVNYYEGVTKILFTGKAIDIPGLMKFSSNLLQIPCELFDPEKLFAQGRIKNKLPEDPKQWCSYAVALGTAIPYEKQSEFDLRRKAFALTRFDIISKQLLASLVIMVLMIVVIGVKGYLQISSFKSKINQIEAKEVGNLIKIFPKDERPQKQQLQSLVSKADKLLKEKSEMWAPFSQERMKFLEILLEITSIIDKKRFNVDIEDLTIDEKESGNPVVEIDGYFKSERGAGYHFEEFEELQKRFDASTLLMPAEPISPAPAAEKGIRFSIKLKKKEN